ncbi:MAG: hypothetical protein ACOX0A_00580 [Thermoguttaceae bacterium]|jgi:hypothetical protein
MVKSNKYKEYDDLGVRFIYPNNWTVQTETWDKGTYGISVDCPDGSFWALAIYPKNVDVDEAARKILTALYHEYNDVEGEKIKRYVADQILQGYEINFYYLDLASTAQALIFEDDERGYVIFWQTCDRLLLTDEEMAPRVEVFEVMTYTLISNLTGQLVDWEEDEDEELELVKSAKEIRAEEDREFYRQEYIAARKEIQQEYWRSGGEITSQDSGLENFVTTWSNKSRRPAKRSRRAGRADERFEDFLRRDDGDDDFSDDAFNGKDYE